MKWIKQGIIFAPNKKYGWMQTHASVPVADRLNDDVFRIFFGTRDTDGVSHIGYVDVEADNPGKVIAVSEKPVLPLGKLGTFDDRGIMPSWIVRHGEERWLYYIAWNPQVSVSYRLSIGLAISRDGGRTFRKYSEGPICDRSVEEPYFNSAPCVLHEGAIWKMWYVSCTAWQVVDGHPEPLYHVKRADSPDGIHWRRTGLVCIDYGNPARAVGRPCVFKENGKYRMLYSHRGIAGYRSNPETGYRLGYAESNDGVDWVKKDDEVGIERSEQGWDSQMMEYCFVLDHKDKTYLFYNGNDFGASGFGYATQEK